MKNITRSKVKLLGILFLMVVISNVNADNGNPDTVCIDFGYAILSNNYGSEDYRSDTSTWTNVTEPKSDSVYQLINLSKDTTDITLTITDDFYNRSNRGLSTGLYDLNADGIPTMAVRDYFYGNVGGTYQKNPVGEIKLDNLDAQTIYTIELLSSNSSSKDINYETQFVVIGSVFDTLRIDSKNNITLLSTSMTTAADGTITISVTAGPNNTSDTKTFYLNAIRIIYTESVVTSLASQEKLLCDIYPNPAQDRVSIQVDQESTLTIYSLSGKIVKEGRLCVGTNTFSLDLKTGLYLVKVTNVDNTSVTKKLVID